MKMEKLHQVEFVFLSLVYLYNVSVECIAELTAIIVHNLL